MSLNLHKQKPFQPEQVYVVLHHITNFERLHLSGSYNRALIKTDVAAKDEYGQLKLH